MGGLNADIELELDDSTVEMSKKCRNVDDGRQEARRTSLLLCLIRVATMIAEAARGCRGCLGRGCLATMIAEASFTE